MSWYQSTRQKVTSYSHRTKTSWLIFYAILREMRRLRRSFLVFTTSKMTPRRCVMQYCSRVSHKELGISMHTSPSSGNICTKCKRFTSRHRQSGTKKWEFRSTIATENVCHLILVGKDLLIKARQFVQLNCGIRFKLRGCFLAQLTDQHGNQVTHSNAVYIDISS